MHTVQDGFSRSVYKVDHWVSWKLLETSGSLVAEAEPLLLTVPKYFLRARV